ncbi:MAG: mandelate racemase/muconate lactonizing enzyme family protein [Verrucomicrobiota bacterium]|nr:mandelate racemase/muconate lactonizing enzyme family protein [Verrucomicrobiota bacterium]
MIIKSIEPHLLSCPLPEPVIFRFYNGQRTIYKRDAMVVRIETQDGAVGYAPGPASEDAVRKIENEIAPHLLGQKLEDPSHFVEDMLDKYGSTIWSAAGAVEVALFDLWGKANQCSITEFFGGRKQDSVSCYGSAGMYQTAEKYAEEAAAVCELGFEAYKFRPALGPAEDLRTVELMRAAVGSDVGLCLDAHAWWRMGDASYSSSIVEFLAEAISMHDITWLEEPLPVEDREAYSKLKALGYVEIAAGEHEHDFLGFRTLLGRDCVDIVQADVSHHGGLSGISKIIDLCEKRYATFAFHNWGTSLETVVDALIGSCFPRETVRWLEYPQYAHRDQRVMYPFPLSDEVVPDAPVPENGDLPLPDGYGLGVEVDEKVFSKYPYQKGSWSKFEIDKDSVVYT